MRMYYVIFLLLILNSCSGQRENLKYPSDQNEIANVCLEQPDEKTQGRFALIQKLTGDEITQLIEALNNAKVAGPVKFKPEYYIIFETKAGKTLRLRAHKNLIKGYDSDLTYKIEELDFLKHFGKK
jgi:hypothetical protein